MVSERQSQTDSGTDYDNLNGTANTDTDDADTTIGEQNASDRSSNAQRSASSTPTISLCAREGSVDKFRACKEAQCTGTPERRPRNSLSTSKRTYRIIDSDMSQRLLQLVAAEKMAAAYNTEKGSRILRRKGSFAIGCSPKMSPFQSQHQSSCPPQRLANDDTVPKTTNARTHFDVVRTASFGGNVNRQMLRQPDLNRNSLPLSVLTLSFE
ncbi:hypothetical protein Tcan_14626 [Toxocara canis]|uniref:Uncharacterized protein n=1 Tax=Toxocara canis TaxID=6265 RepID=A0A0B2V8E5_TOXCA|nr:hypothetical protein Tcan_14626 [Toxocara canis]